MAFIKMLSLIILLWILPSINAGGQEDHFQTVHDAVSKMRKDQYDTIIDPILRVYNDRLWSLFDPTRPVVVWQKTNNSVYILDTLGFFLGTRSDHISWFFYFQIS